MGKLMVGVTCFLALCAVVLLLAMMVPDTAFAQDHPRLTLSLNQSSFQPGDTHTLTATVTPGGSASPVDVYLVLQLPDQTLHFYQSNGSFTAEMQPLVGNWTVVPFSGELFRHLFTGAEQAGTYIWSAGFTAPGTQNVIGDIAQAPFTFNPSPSSLSFDVTSTSGWQTTSLNVTAGQQLSFSAEGAWTVDYRFFSYVGPDGYTPVEDSQIYQGCKLNPQLPYAKLLARVGDSPSFWAIGSNGAFTADSSGVLSFRIHDGDTCLVDNAGSVQVAVTASVLEGPDANGDGVWDYIEVYIDQNYPDSTARPALRAIAVAMQGAMLAANDPAASVNAATVLQRAIECLYFVRQDEARAVKNDLKAVLLNTLERSKAYLRFSDQLGGQIFPSTPLSELQSACNF